MKARRRKGIPTNRVRAILAQGMSAVVLAIAPLLVFAAAPSSPRAMQAGPRCASLQVNI